MESQAKISFEQAIDRLEEIVQQLDGGNLTLDESLLLFEEGVKLARECSGKLTEVQGRLEMLTKTDDGKVEAEPFEM